MLVGGLGTGAVAGSAPARMPLAILEAEEGTMALSAYDLQRQPHVRLGSLPRRQQRRAERAAHSGDGDVVEAGEGALTVGTAAVAVTAALTDQNDAEKGKDNAAAAAEEEGEEEDAEMGEAVEPMVRVRWGEIVETVLCPICLDILDTTMTAKQVRDGSGGVSRL